MKRYLFILITAGLCAACNPTADSSAPAATKAATTAIEEGKEVSLNRDAKWQADASTAKNVSLLQQNAAELNKAKNKTAADYQHISSELQTGINQLVKECKMIGADHDALHLWLEPLMGEIKELKTVTATNTGDRLFHSIRTRLADYNLYFQ